MTALAVTIAAIFILATNSSSTTDLQNGTDVKEIAESGAENALLKLERDTSYTGETYTEGNATVTTVVTGSNIKIATTSAVGNNSTKKVEVTVDYSNNILTVLSWKEIF